MRSAVPSILLAAALACGGGGESSPAADGDRYLGEDAGGPATTEALVDSLRERGIPVKAIGISNPRWFAPQGAFFGMDGQEVQVFEYEDAASARTDVAEVAASGEAVAGSTSPGEGPTRLYRRGPLVVLVQGESDRLQGTLGDLLGDPVAGPDPDRPRAAGE